MNINKFVNQSYFLGERLKTFFLH